MTGMDVPDKLYVDWETYLVRLGRLTKGRESVMSNHIMGPTSTRMHGN
jgi:hypothetical protein